MHHKVLGKIALPLLSTRIKKEAIRLRNLLESSSNSVIRAPMVQSKMHLTFFENKELVGLLRKSIFPANFNTESFSIYNHQVFITPPGDGFEIHKDGLEKRSAINILIQGSELDWTRWYSDETVETQYGGTVAMSTPENTSANRYSRNIGNLPNYPTIPCIDELTGITSGTIYLVNTNVYHSFFNNGNDYRIVLQTNFTGNPSIQQLYDRIQETGLLNVKPV